MDVNGDRRTLRVRARACGLAVGGGGVSPLRRRRIRRVPGALDVVLLEQLRGHRERLATEPDRDRAHAREVSTGASVPVSGAGALTTQSLDQVGSGARAAATKAATFSGGVGGRMPWPRFTMWPTRPARLPHAPRRSEEDAGVDVPLQRLASCALARLVERELPVDGEDVDRHLPERVDEMGRARGGEDDG